MTADSGYGQANGGSRRSVKDGTRDFSSGPRPCLSRPGARRVGRRPRRRIRPLPQAPSRRSRASRSGHSTPSSTGGRSAPASFVERSETARDRTKIPFLGRKISWRTSRSSRSPRNDRCPSTAAHRPASSGLSPSSFGDLPEIALRSSTGGLDVRGRRPGPNADRRIPACRERWLRRAWGSWGSFAPRAAISPRRSPGRPWASRSSTSIGPASKPLGSNRSRLGVNLQLVLRPNSGRRNRCRPHLRRPLLPRADRALAPRSRGRAGAAGIRASTPTIISTIRGVVRACPLPTLCVMPAVGRGGLGFRPRTRRTCCPARRP